MFLGWSPKNSISYFSTHAKYTFHCFLPKFIPRHQNGQREYPRKGSFCFSLTRRENEWNSSFCEHILQPSASLRRLQDTHSVDKTLSVEPLSVPHRWEWPYLLNKSSSSVLGALESNVDKTNRDTNLHGAIYICIMFSTFNELFSQLINYLTMLIELALCARVILWY